MTLQTDGQTDGWGLHNHNIPAFSSKSAGILISLSFADFAHFAWYLHKSVNR